MGYLQQYIDTLNNDDLAVSVEETAKLVTNNIHSNFSFLGQMTSLLLGNVQSGKTGQMLGVISDLADNGYKVFILLTTDNIDLHRQTYNRVKRSLSTFVVLTERDVVLFNPNNLIQPIVIVLKKNARVLHKWSNLFVNSKICNGLCLCIFDDEADASSLNTLVNKNRISTINKHLKKIKDSSSSSLYFEVTATPQSVLLQSSISGWKPSFINYFKPGLGYLGGNFFYSNPTSYCIKFTSETELEDINEDGDILCPIGLSQSIMSFLVVCAYKKIRGEANCNFMIHPSARIYIHEKFTQCVQEHLNLLQQSSSDEGFDDQMIDAWSDLQSTMPDLPHYELIKDAIIEILDNTMICVIPLNSRSFVSRDANDPDALDLSKGFNIIIGGNTLGRGITFPHLQTVYYCRSSKVIQADTYWQHSRIFGYDREKELVRIFIPRSLHALFVSLNEANEILIKQIQNDLDRVQIIYPKGIVPTRKNVLDNNYVKIIVGGVNMFASNPISVNTDAINNIVENYATNESVETTFDEIIQILEYVGSVDSLDFDSNWFISCIRALQIKLPTVKCRLIVRIDRNIGKGTGTLLSPSDRLLGDKFSNDIVLTLYRVVGSKEKGWEGFPLWIPNIKFPNHTLFYDSVE